MVSLVPFATAWVASTRLAVVPVFVYAAVFVLVELAYLQFEHHALPHAVAEEVSPRTRQIAKIRSLVAFGLFFTAMLVSLKFPKWGFALVCCAVLLHLLPDPRCMDRGYRCGSALVSRSIYFMCLSCMNNNKDAKEVMREKSRIHI
jgi:uncharacterized membrane protein